MIGESPALAPWHRLRFSQRCLALVLAFVLAVGSVVPVQAQSFGGEYYRGGNATFGDFGGFGYDAGNSYGGPLVEASIEGGKGIDLGCGAINIMDYMKATFDVSNLIERAKASMQTMVAKYVMVFLLSQPIIASAMDKLNGMLNFGFDMFNQSCDMNEIQQLAKARWKRECLAGGENPINCQEMPDPMKPLLKDSMIGFGEDMDRILSDPVGALRESLGCSSDSTHTARVWVDDTPQRALFDTNAGHYENVEGVAQSDTCIMLAFAPRLCGSIGGDASGPLIGKQALNAGGCNSSQSPVSSAAIKSGVETYADSVITECARVWDNIREANPQSTVADLKIIAADAIAMANASGGVGAIISREETGGPTKLALTSSNYLTRMYGARSAASESILKDYRESDIGLKGCSVVNRTDPLRMCTLIAKAANVHFSKTGGARISEDVTLDEEAKKANTQRIFNTMEGLSDEARKAIAADMESAAIMMEETFSCLANGQAGMDSGVPMTNPEIGWRIATGSPINIRGKLQQVGWRELSMEMSKPISCKSVDKIFTFFQKRWKSTKNAISINGKMPISGATRKNSDGTITNLPPKKVETNDYKQVYDPIFDQIVQGYEYVLRSNDRACAIFGNPNAAF